MTSLRHTSLLHEARLSAGRTPTLRIVPDLDQATRDARDRFRQYVAGSLTIVPGPAPSAHDPQTLGYRDAADECAHGHLPNDRHLTCQCWDQMRAAA